MIGGFRWMPVARLVRAQFFSLREKEFVEAARALGASVPRQVVRHILPNSLGPVIVAATIDVAAAIIVAFPSVLKMSSSTSTATISTIHGAIATTDRTIGSHRRRQCCHHQPHRHRSPR